jgi:quinoprotein glucose dehydrogenase
VSLGVLDSLRRSRILVLAALVLAGRGESAGSGDGDAWPVVGRDSGSSRYSALADIDRTNVGRLKVAWTYHHGDVRAGWPIKLLQGTSFEATPILVEGFLVFNTPYSRVIALDPASGAERWSFDPEIDRGRRFHSAMANRGVAYWSDPGSDGPCASRILLGALDGRLIALDLRTGAPCESFGRQGTVDLLAGIEPLVDSWEYNLTSPPLVVGDVVVVGSSISDQVRRVQPPGAVRGYDARSGRLVWRFDTIPRAGEYGVETWQREGWRETGGANVWGILTADLGRGLVFLPVSAAGPDLYGGDRPGENLFSNSVVALDAKTGKRIWHFQTVHHDLWDYDLAAPPNLVRLKRDGREIYAVAQVTKTGFVFLLDRDTGAPLFPVEERPVPPSDVPGEVAWPTQPFPTRPAPLVPQRLTEEDLRAEDPRLLERCRATLRSLRNEGIFTPPSERGTIAYPWAWGGATWAGAAFDPETGVLYVPTNNAAAVVRVKKLHPGNFEKNDGLMLQSLFNLAWWRFTGEAPGLRYAMSSEPFFEGGLPCNRPPWGTLSAVDLGQGEILWQVPLGETEDGIRGTVNFGPPLVTAGGLVFQGGGLDSRFRAHDTRTGEVLATFELPAGLHAGPMTYRLEGRQYLVVAPGGHVRLGSKLGDAVIAYTLP